MFVAESSSQRLWRMHLTGWTLAAAILVLGQVIFSTVDLSAAWFLNQCLTLVVPTIIGIALIAAVRLPLVAPASGMLAFGLFFAISATSLVGLTQTLTGSHAQPRHVALYGLSFYTTTLAYLVACRKQDGATSFMLTNPLVLVTGPILTRIGSIRHRRLSRRLGYYLPFVLLGTFLHQTIATPLTKSFHLITRTDLLSSVTFAAIFELFVYANFCGLSLLVYGLAGILGIKIPLNFRQPFSASNMVEFWRGWHVSLSTVLKALFYAPARRIAGPTAAVFAVYLASAMWHGVTLNFLLWGVFHACVFWLTVWMLKSRWPGLATFATMLLGIVIGRLIFADADTGRLLAKLHFEFQGFGIVGDLLALPKPTQLGLVMAAAFVTVEFALRRHRHFRSRTYKFYRLRSVQLLILAFVLVTLSNDRGIDYAVYGQR